MAWSNTSRHSRGYGTAWDKTRAYILARDNYLCQPCLREGRIHIATEVDHKLPKAKGGTDDEANLQAINTLCHREKTARENGRLLRPKVSTGEDGWPIQPSQ
jgi:5-methylcytosine-specific restriction protein A